MICLLSTGGVFIPEAFIRQESLRAEKKTVLHTNVQHGDD
jgi:hypothetical protein